MSRLRHVEEALAGLTDRELRALKAVCNQALIAVPGLRAWVESACDCEIDRRRGRAYGALPPLSAIDPAEDQLGIEAVYAIRAAFATGDQDNGALTFFDELIQALIGGSGRGH